MKNHHVHNVLHDRIFVRAGLTPKPSVDAKAKLRELELSEWSPEFEQLMRNRLVMGALRYGKLDPAKGKPYDRTRMILLRVAGYVKTGNTELLVDAANLCLIEFVEGRHPLKHFRADDRRD